VGYNLGVSKEAVIAHMQLEAVPTLARPAHSIDLPAFTLHLNSAPITGVLQTAADK
jgi:hypothetical protein